jgi:predicted nucleotidyltransferase
MDINLDEQIKNIISQIIEKYKPDKIILFGSAARGDLNAQSDVDFIIIKQDTPYWGAERIRELSRLISRDIAVDFFIYRPDEFEMRLSMGDPFLESIIKEGKVLYG